MRIRIRYATVFSLLLPLTVFAQAPEKHGTVERIKLHGKALEGNLEGDSPDRDVSVYLPPSYKAEPNRRYPVIYLLHGFNATDNSWYANPRSYFPVPTVVDKSLNAGTSREMILVTPNAYTTYAGSNYSNAVTTGNWEDFLVKELVAYVDKNYRTVANPASRGLAGHSMGGYGTLRISMKYPGVFSSIYALSPCCLAPGNNIPDTAEARAKLEGIKSVEEFRQAEFATKAAFAAAASWAPNPDNPPFYFDLPVKNGELRPEIAAKFSANQPLAMIDQYIPALKQLHAIAFDAGDQDTQIAANIGVLDKVMKTYGLAHFYAIYPGTHTSGIAERAEKQMLPFFTKNLVFPDQR